MARVLGVDPDSTMTGWAVVDGSQLLSVGVWRAKRDKPTFVLREMLTQIEHTLDAEKPEFVVVEGQSYHPGSPATPADIIKVAQIAGGIVGVVVARGMSSRVCMPEPELWKGQVPKAIHQARTFTSLGIAYDRAPDYCWPTDTNQIRKTRGAAAVSRTGWKHVADACGLALWGETAVLSMRSTP